MLIFEGPIEVAAGVTLEVADLANHVDRSGEVQGNGLLNQGGQLRNREIVASWRRRRFPDAIRIEGFPGHRRHPAVWGKRHLSTLSISGVCESVHSPPFICRACYFECGCDIDGHHQGCLPSVRSARNRYDPRGSAGPPTWLRRLVASSPSLSGLRRVHCA